MKKLFVSSLVSMAGLFLVGCGQTPMTDADMAAQYGLSVEEFQEQKEVAARMNMNIEDHLNMDSMDHSMMNHESMDSGESDCDESVDDVCPNPDDVSMDMHEKAAADMGMTLEEHEAAGHIGH